MSEPKVVNMKHGFAPTFGSGGAVIRVDRGSEWGNPFVMKSEDYRHYVCAQYERYAHWRLTIEPEWLKPLRGKNLACWCAPNQCHADTLLRLANEEGTR